MSNSRRRTAATAALFATILLSTASAQTQVNGYRLTGPTNVASSGSSTIGDAHPFGTATIQLSCPASPIVTLSSSPDGSGKVLVDNYVNVTVGTTTTNICNVSGAAFDAATQTAPAFYDCFTDAWHTWAGTYSGQNPDTFVVTNNPDLLNLTLANAYGVGPINVSSYFAPNATTTARFDDVDWGGIVAASSLYVATNCSVTGGTSTTNTPITATSGQIQTFTFNGGAQTLTGNWSQAGVDTSQNAVPSVTNRGISPSDWPKYVANTSFATTQCLPHIGEQDPFGNVLCKAYTLTCTLPGGTTASGSNCPQSTFRNILFTDAFDVPGGNANPLLIVANKNNNLGFGFLMGSDDWGPGHCALTGVESGLLCPQNLAVSFHDILSGGTTKGTNSTFLVVTGVPLPSTLVNGQGNGGTITATTATPLLTFVSTPGTAANVNGFTPAPIESITYGIDSGPPYPDTTFPIPTDQVLMPLLSPCSAPASPVTATAQPTLALGSHTLHFFATDCAATEELVYDTSDLTNPANWASFKTVTINVMGQFGGFLQPVDNPPTLNSVKAGSAVPVKFSLGGNYGLNIFASGYPASVTTTCSSTAPVDAIETTVSAGSSSLQYDPTSNTYTYVWKTSSVWGGSCRQLVVKFADGTSAHALFKFK